MITVIILSRRLPKKSTHSTFAIIDNKIKLTKVKAEADVELYCAMKGVEVNLLRLTSKYPQVEACQATAINNKIYFDECIPNVFLDNSRSGADGALLDNIIINNNKHVD